MGLQTINIPCKGGLNLSATNQELLSMPNEAIRLVNMESSKSGGYRRISGFTEYGTTSVPGAGEIKGIFTYLGGVLAARGTDLYHSFDGATWTKVNKLVEAVDNATLVGTGDTADLSVVNEQPLQIDVYTEGTKDHIYIATGNSDPLYLLIEGTEDADAVYTFRNTSLGSSLTGAKWLVLYQDQVILGNTTDAPTSFIYSSFPTTDLTVAELAALKTPREKYDGSTAGIISVKRPITGLAAHRGRLYVFTERTISRVQGLRDGNAQVVPITEDVGCVDGNTIQEIGGDLVFLAADGLRTVSQTERIDDIELGVISRKIAPITDNLLNNLSKLTFTSAVIREKNQYRLWYKNSDLPLASNKGIIAAFAFDSGTGGFRWDFSEIEGWEANVAYSGTDSNGTEFLVHGDDTGKVYKFEDSFSFDGAPIRWLYQSAFTDFGDVGIRKNIHKVFVNMKPEGDVNAELVLKYDYQSSGTAQPDPYVLEEQTLPAIFGDLGVTFGDTLVRYGAAGLSDNDIFTEGSGFTVSFIVRDRDLEDSSFEIQSLQVNFTPSGRI